MPLSKQLGFQGRLFVPCWDSPKDVQSYFQGGVGYGVKGSRMSCSFSCVFLMCVCVALVQTKLFCCITWCFSTRVPIQSLSTLLSENGLKLRCCLRPGPVGSFTCHGKTAPEPDSVFRLHFGNLKTEPVSTCHIKTWPRPSTQVETYECRLTCLSKRMLQKRLFCIVERTSCAFRSLNEMR